MTGGTDKVVKVWNITEHDGRRDISLTISRDLGVVSNASHPKENNQLIVIHCRENRGRSSRLYGHRMIPLLLQREAQKESFKSGM